MTTPTLHPESPRRDIPPAALIAGGLVVVAVIVGGSLMMRRGGDTGVQPTAPVKTTAGTGRHDIAQCALSPDGRYLAYTIGGQGSLWVRQVGTVSDVQILPPQRDVPHDLRFTPDGNDLYYLTDDPDRPGFKALFSVPTLGGAPRKRAYDVDSRVAFSPDGKQICFLRGAPQQGRGALIVLDLERGQERALAIWSAPVSFLPAPPDWSPDGKRVAVVETRSAGPFGSTVVTFRVRDGRREVVGKEAWVDIDEISWLPDGSGFAISAFERSTRTAAQLWTLTYPDGRFRRIASGPGFYSNLGLSADGATLAALRYRQGMNLWLAAATGTRDVRQITFADEESEISSFDPGEASTIYFEMFHGASAEIWRVGEDGAGQTPVTSGPRRTFSPYFRSGAGIFYVREEEDLSTHIWRADANGDNARAVTSGAGERLVDISPDGRRVLFQRDDAPDVLWSASSDGGQPFRIGESFGLTGLFSPDGSRILHVLVDTTGGEVVVTPRIVPATGGEPAVTPALPPRTRNELWTPDGKGITYLGASNDQRNLFRLRLGGGKPEEITRFADGRIWQYLWSPDGKHLLLHRRVDDVDNLWVTDAGGKAPVAITAFKAGDITGVRWTRDGRRVVLMHGESSQGVALVHNFR